MTQARTTDPPTSHAAAEKAEKSGRAKAQRAVCLDCVKWMQGLTAAEIAAYTGLERHAASRRLPELRKAGFVHNGTVTRECRITGNQSMTWWPVLYQREMF